MLGYLHDFTRFTLLVFKSYFRCNQGGKVLLYFDDGRKLILNRNRLGIIFNNNLIYLRQTSKDSRIHVVCQKNLVTLVHFYKRGFVASKIFLVLAKQLNSVLSKMFIFLMILSFV